MTHSEVRVGVMGLGRAGSFHLESLSQMESARASVVFDVDHDRSAKVAARYGCQSAASAEELLRSDDVDAVIVATPTDIHFPLVQMGLEQNKPVLTEKPLGRHLHEIDQCFQFASQKSLPLFVAFQRRFDISFSAVIDGVRNGKVGQLQYIRSVSRDNPVPSVDYLRISGGIFHDCMVHDLDMVVQIAGQIPTHISSFGASFIPSIGELGDYDSVVASLAFADGVTATIDINRRSVYGYDQRIEAFGDGGMLIGDNQHSNSVINANEAGFGRATIDYSFPSRYRQAYFSELDCFIRCVRGEQEVPITHQDVRNNYLLALGVETAAKQRRVVEFDEIEAELVES